MIRSVGPGDSPKSHLSGEHYAMLDPQGSIMAYLGLLHHWAGVGRVYFDFANRYDFSISETRMMLKEIKSLLDERYPYYDRIEATVLTHSTNDQKFAERLGFVREGTLVRYFDGEDHEMMRYER
jgi:hypothetical protein